MRRPSTSEELAQPSRLGGEGGKNVAVAGTPEQLSADSVPTRIIAMTARPGNTGKIAYGFTDAVDATPGAEVGALLDAGQSVSLPVANLNLVYLDAEVGGEGVSFTWVK